MVFIDNEGVTDPHYNLALEEYALRNFSADTDYLLFYINEPSIIIGRNQNTLEEINQKYIQEQGIHVVRRVSGGGAVYHDLGNLNFSFITNHDNKSLHNFKKFTAPVIKVLKRFGVEAELIGRNDILIDGKKVSGTAQFTTGKRMFSHGTLLLNTDLNEVAKALQVKMSKIQSKGHKSVRSRVANISDFLDEHLTIEAFRTLILEGLYADDTNFKTYKFTDADREGIAKLKAERYDDWHWNYGRSPKFNIQRTKRFPIGEIDLRIFVEKGHITEFTIFGDFFGKTSVDELAAKLIGLPYEERAIKDTLQAINLTEYFGAIDSDDFINMVYGDDELETINSN
ncbi:lipoate--protein ligase [Formosa sediminum]|uniref:lipoate--protein ligase n=1 Tax=Formosa sediminum TaxID=2594004 RepID=A0A516GNX2_9FLAO|nr:lipoate--protein ligase [Formosa sediminum]QDO93193.1 lipoate--protein ligase [Formosa sediminum]